ncbi:senescence-specific cysteine protease SAG39 [Trifolium repens]|nr:senescence-specific cysteine protease SAG39 [Trifolium repens]
MEDITSCVVDIPDDEWAAEIKVVLNTSEAVLAEIPRSFDWRQKGAITPVRNQGQLCGACWAFVTAAAIESAEYIFNNGFNGLKLEQLSPQSLIDCVEETRGCEGADVRKAFIWAAKSVGLPEEAEYPYTGIKEPCKLSPFSFKIDIDGYAVLHSFEDSISVAVTRQPVVVEVHVGPDFRAYQGGIFKGPCGNGSHGLLLVGFGETDEGEKYWILKNSWGENWGEQGYVRMLRDFSEDGLCDINKRVIYPIPLLA